MKEINLNNLLGFFLALIPFTTIFLMYGSGMQGMQVWEGFNILFGFISLSGLLLFGISIYNHSIVRTPLFFTSIVMTSLFCLWTGYIIGLPLAMGSRPVMAEFIYLLVPLATLILQIYAWFRLREHVENEEKHQENY